MVKFTSLVHPAGLVMSTLMSCWPGGSRLSFSSVKEMPSPVSPVNQM